MRCKACNQKFKQRFIGHALCDDEVCKSENEDVRVAYAIEDARTKVKKEANKKKKEFRENDTVSLKEIAQKTFNTFIRMRDKGKPCISCDAHIDGGHASHFFSVGGNSALRFCEWNVHLSCLKCNVFLHGNLEAYKPRLINKIGAERFALIEAKRGEIKKYDAKYYRRIIAIYRKKIKRLK